ncbi:MAG: FAD-dependent oxidoreductase [Acidobacteria bacterium]|nr:FAD-dependent oxidoreductase [Acidobacteriota bacterium]
MKLPKTDAVIVGAGAAGGVVAYELAKAGLHVVLLERGPRLEFSDTGHDELRSQRTWVLGSAFGPDDERHIRLIGSGDPPVFRRTLPSDSGYNHVAACVGGGTKSYGAMAWRFLPQDFQMRSTYGTVEGSTLEDWPIRYEELEPYYEKAEWEIGVSGDAGSNHFEGPRKKGYPTPALPFNKEARFLADAAKRRGLHPFPIPMAINSELYAERPCCIACPHCVGFACEVHAKSSTADTVIPRAEKTGNCELRTECVAKEVLTDARGRATGVAYFQGRELIEQPADVVIVSCSATESPRLLLNSKSKLFPQGLGNRNDWVGRNLQGHAYSGAAAVFDEELFDGTGPAARVALCDYSHGNQGVVGGAMLANEFIRLPYLFSQRGPTPTVGRWGAAHKEFMRSYYKRSAGLKGPVQEMPVFASRVEVDDSLKDYWGIPVAKISGHRHPQDRETGRFLAERAAEILKEAGGRDISLSLPGLGVSGGQHQAGTCRMGDDPKTSVTTKHGKLHDVDNVFVIDGSLHVTNGGFNPSLTIQALAFWCSEYLVREWKGTRFR